MGRHSSCDSFAHPASMLHWVYQLTHFIQESKRSPAKPTMGSPGRPEYSYQAESEYPSNQASNANCTIGVAENLLIAAVTFHHAAAIPNWLGFASPPHKARRRPD